MSKPVPLIETENLTIAVPVGLQIPFLAPHRLDIVVDVSVSIGKGEILAMVGESGSGKTTFGRSLVGLMPPVSGTIKVEGQALPDFSTASFKALRQQAALLFQDPVTSFNPRQRIGSIIAEPRKILNSGSTKFAELSALADSVGLSAAFLRRFPHELSGGQARRAAVARALSVVPKLIIADEPTAGLDVSVQGGVLNLFLDIREARGTAFLLITHNLAVARHVSDRIAILYLGRVVETGPTAKLFAAPRHPYTQALLQSEPIPDPKHRRTEPPVLGEVPTLSERPSGCEFHKRCRYAQDICKSVRPAETKLTEDHRIACHFPLP